MLGQHRRHAARRPRRRAATRPRARRCRRWPPRDRRSSSTSCRRWRPPRSACRPAARSSAIAAAQRVGPHAERVVGRDLHDGLVAEAEQDDGLVDRRVRLVRAVDAQPRHVVAAREPVRAHAGHAPLARRRQRVQRRDRRRVVDDALERVGQAHQLPQPAERDRLEFGRRRRRAPEHRLLVERRRQELGEHAGRAGGNREVGQEPRVVPVRQARARGRARSRRGWRRTARPARAPAPAALRAMSPGATRASTG